VVDETKGALESELSSYRYGCHAWIRPAQKRFVFDHEADPTGRGVIRGAMVVGGSDVGDMTKVCPKLVE
jgi:hypothetical protein